MELVNFYKVYAHSVFSGGLQCHHPLYSSTASLHVCLPTFFLPQQLPGHLHQTSPVRRGRGMGIGELVHFYKVNGHSVSSGGQQCRPRWR